MIKWITLLLVVFLLSCEKSGIMTYKVPKQTVTVAQLSVQGSYKMLVWSVPEAWIEQDLTSFRLSSYQVSTQSNGIGDFSVVKFPGDAGGILANVNRWRGQLGLSSISVDDLASLFVRVEHPFLSITFLELHRVNKMLSSDDIESMYVGFFMYDNESYFFKLTGSKTLLQLNRESFITILKSIAYESS